MKKANQTGTREQQFTETVWQYYHTHGRHDLPWRNISKSLPRSVRAYRILVSEVMLQQTQVPRVVTKYASFLKLFPTVHALAGAPLGSVLREWQGLGYNRRAKMLHACAQAVVESYGGTFPRTYHELLALPGIGPYTAGAVMAFAYNEPVVLIETNVRTVYLHHFFKSKTAVPDTEILALVARTLDHDNPRAWYAAIMDYGTYLKQRHGNPNARSKHYVRQSAFKGSDRQIRGAILRSCTNTPVTIGMLEKQLDAPAGRIAAQLTKLCAEGLIIKRGRRYALPD